MTTDLFSSLDSNQINRLSFLLWSIPVVFRVSFLTSLLWIESPNKIIQLLIFSNRSETNQKKVMPLKLFVFRVIFFLVQLNFTGIFPFVLGATRSLWLAGSLALSLWGSLILSRWVKFPKESAAHLVPAGAPAALAPLLVVIETIRILIRPLTLTVRLVANIRAGHIVLSLIASCLVRASFIVMVPTFMVFVGYRMFEIFVCLIQAYIFSLLVKLYAEEHPFDRSF